MPCLRGDERASWHSGCFLPGEMHEIGKLLARAREVGASAHDGTRLSALLRDVGHAESVPKLAKKVCPAVRRLLPCDAVGFLLFEGDRVTFAEGDAAHRAWRTERSAFDPLIASWLRRGDPAIVEDTRTDQQISPEAYRPTFARSLAAQPIGSPPRGALVAYWTTPRRPTSRELLLIEIIADTSDRALASLKSVQSRGGPTTGERLNRMVAVAAHDLRNPLSSIISGTEILLRRGELATRDAEVIRRIRRNADRAARLVSQLLQFSIIEEDRGLALDLRPVAVDQLAKAVVKELEVTYPDRRIRIEVKEPIFGFVDREKLADVLIKLLKNAVLHGDPKEPIDVLLDRAGEEARIRIHNFGPPIPPEAVPQLFEPFRKLGSNGAEGTLGLGLFIAQQIARAHGGRIEVASTEADGTTFSIHLPLPPAEIMEPGEENSVD